MTESAILPRSLPRSHRRLSSVKARTDACIRIQTRARKTKTKITPTVTPSPWTAYSPYRTTSPTVVATLMISACAPPYGDALLMAEVALELCLTAEQVDDPDPERAPAHAVAAVIVDAIFRARGEPDDAHVLRSDAEPPDARARAVGARVPALNGARMQLDTAVEFPRWTGKPRATKGCQVLRRVDEPGMPVTGYILRTSWSIRSLVQQVSHDYFSDCTCTQSPFYMLKATNQLLSSKTHAASRQRYLQAATTPNTSTCKPITIF